MGQFKGGDCRIKLFGATIPVPESGGGGDMLQDLPQTHDATIVPASRNDEDHKPAISEAKPQLHHAPLISDDVPEPQIINNKRDDLSEKEKDSAAEEEQSADSDNSKEKALKKPDKILPCPRCKSMDTKFCYYNNYNINQPRHFCKNCQRYWTAGGAMRNVPVGAGRRKSKTHYLQRLQPNGIPEPVCPPMQSNGSTVLRFGADVPLCESMASSLDLSDRAENNCGRNGQSSVSEKLVTAMACTGRSEEQSIGSCVEQSEYCKEEGKSSRNDVKDNVAAAAAQNCQAAPNSVPFPYMNGSMWPYNCAPAPAYYTSGIAIPFYPAAAAAAYWGCMVPGAWSFPWPPAPPSPFPQAAASPNGVCSLSSGSATSSLTLGKHSREGEATKSSRSSGDESSKDDGSCIWIPKTLRIDDPGDAARSSIWTMVGAKDGAAEDFSSGRKLSKIFQPIKGGEAKKGQTVESSRLLHANPAALSRSMTFQEGY